MEIQGTRFLVELSPFNYRKKTYKELDNIGNGEFFGEYVYIHLDNVSLNTLNNRYYLYILQYITSNDPNIIVEQSSPKKVLYSPLHDIRKRVKLIYLK